MGTLSQFSAEIRKNNLARPYLYYVEIFAPTLISTGTTSFNNEMINMFCASASTPFINMFTNDSFNENGIKRKYTYDYDYQPLVLQFYVDQGYETKNFFDVWMKHIVPSERKFNYYDDYRSPLIRVSLINTAGDDVYQYYYIGSVPKTVSNIDLSYAAHGSISTFNVEFVYETMSFVKVGRDSAFIETTFTDTTSGTKYALTNNLEMSQYLGLKFNTETFKT